MARAQAADAVLLAAVGGPKWDAVPYEVGPEAGLLRLRKDMNLFANLRPAICYPALADASSLKRELVDGLDLMVVRELTGGVYFGEPKQIIDLGNGQKRAIDTQDYHTYEIERIGRVAFELAGQRRNKVPSSGRAQCDEIRRPLGRSDHRFARAGIIPMSSLLQSQTIPKDRKRHDQPRRHSHRIEMNANRP
jgi:isocitrate/isopropylmalate dehydrogenase